MASRKSVAGSCANRNHTTKPQHSLIYYPNH
nr:MAG TPA: hypothetical protein [Caudoviricetes sp.]DAL57338.1 MAG TPA_asm: hypothetical protein [Caudoviricetes sp.]